MELEGRGAQITGSNGVSINSLRAAMEGRSQASEMVGTAERSSSRSARWYGTVVMVGMAVEVARDGTNARNREDSWHRGDVGPEVGGRDGGVDDLGVEGGGAVAKVDMRPWEMDREHEGEGIRPTVIGEEAGDEVVEEGEDPVKVDGAGGEDDGGEEGLVGHVGAELAGLEEGLDTGKVVGTGEAADDEVLNEAGGDRGGGGVGDGGGDGAGPFGSRWRA